MSYITAAERFCLWVLWKESRVERVLFFYNT